MTWFRYTVSRQGKEEKGLVEAGTLDEAAAQLKQDGSYILELKERLSLGWLKNSRILENLISPWNQRALKADKLLFTSQLGEMLRTGLPIIKAIEVFVDEKHGQTSTPLKKIMAQLEMGKSLSESLVIYPKIFDQVYISVVHSGETMGKLADSLIYLGRQLKREHDLKNKVRSAMLYPAVVLTAMVAVMSFISMSVVPKIAVFAQNSGAKLPVITLAMIKITAILQQYWPVILGIIIGSVGLLWRGIKTEHGQILVDRIVLKLPLVGSLIRQYNQVRFARLLSGFYRYGINVETAFDILTDCLGSASYSAGCRRIKQRLTRGESLSNSLAREDQLFSGIMSRVVKGAEQTGVLDQTLLKLARFYEKELNDKLNNMTSIIEPILILLLGAGVLGIAMAVIVPIYKVTSQLR